MQFTRRLLRCWNVLSMPSWRADTIGRKSREARAARESSVYVAREEVRKSSLSNVRSKPMIFASICIDREKDSRYVQLLRCSLLLSRILNFDDRCECGIGFLGYSWKFFWNFFRIFNSVGPVLGFWSDSDSWLTWKLGTKTRYSAFSLKYCNYISLIANKR